jgi:competence CoiA-like predicted nuclease
VVLKRSSLGTHFFAHQRTGACNTEPESREHLLAKETTARAALSVGWNATTESRDPAEPPAWIADVLCTRAKKPAKIAFEIQWTRQTHAETERRQTAYASAGVRGLWLMRQRNPYSRRPWRGA